MEETEQANPAGKRMSAKTDLKRSLSFAGDEDESNLKTGGNQQYERDGDEKSIGGHSHRSGKSHNSRKTGKSAGGQKSIS